MIFNLVRRLAAADRARKRWILIGYDVVAMLLALWAAFSARLGELYLPENPVVIAAALLSTSVGIIALQQLGIYRIVLRFFDLQTVSRILLGAALAAVGWVIIIYFARPSMVVDGVVINVPRSVGFIYCGFLFLLLFMGRYVMTAIMAGAEQNIPGLAKGDARNIAIYGANSAGISLGESVRRNRKFRLLAFIDDDPALAGQVVMGVRIYGSADLGRILDDKAIDEIFLAMPKATRAQRLAAISRLNALKVKVKTVPAPEEIISGRFAISDVRPVDVNDLLRRDPVEPLTALIKDAVDGHSILITGAGGSIGSEICRQIARGRPRTLVLLDHSEFALFAIDQQLTEQLAAREDAAPIRIVPIIGSMMNDKLVRRIIREHAIDTIYHAAAYKHVPLLEQNEAVGVENNVFGTLVLARAARDLGLTRFTMISTDKAVRPESVMGASKRVAEMVVQAVADEPGCATRFGIVRFGNVLDSSGSVVQRFRTQIKQGGPVTVTHQDVTRFFMSIPEATQLVLQAGAMAEKGEVFVLDMGEPVRITDLARQMIMLSGMSERTEENPAGDIEIRIVGLRPGEKLYEELFISGNSLETSHPRIKMAKERYLPHDELTRHLDQLQAAIRADDGKAVRGKLSELLAADHKDAQALSGESGSLEESPLGASAATG